MKHIQDHDMDSFEENISSIPRKPLPVSWRERMVDTALGEQKYSPQSSRLTKLFVRSGIGLMAVCWVVIAGLHFMTPSEPNQPPSIVQKDFSGSALLALSWEARWEELGLESL